MFATEDQAKQFAEQHAQVAATGIPLKWTDTNDPMVLTTPVVSIGSPGLTRISVAASPTRSLCLVRAPHYVTGAALGARCIAAKTAGGGCPLPANGFRAKSDAERVGRARPGS